MVQSHHHHHSSPPLTRETWPGAALGPRLVSQRLPVDIFPVRALGRPVFLELRLRWRHLKGLLVQRALEAVFDGFVSLRERLGFGLFLLLASELGPLLFNVGEVLGSSSAHEDKDCNADRDEGDEGDRDADACLGAGCELSPCEVSCCEVCHVLRGLLTGRMALWIVGGTQG